MGTKLRVNKSVTKRLKITKNGKLIARKPGHNHFNAKEGGSEQQNKKRSAQIIVKNNVSSRFIPKLK